jgi:hypothetical protein
MEPASFKFGWDKPAVGGYVWDGGELVPARGTQWAWYYPLDDAPDLYLRFAELTSGDELLAFANAYGHLGLRYRRFADRKEGQALENLLEWHDQAQRMAALLRLWQALSDRDVARMKKEFPLFVGERGEDDLTPPDIDWLRYGWRSLDYGIGTSLATCKVHPWVKHNTKELHKVDQRPPVRLVVGFQTLLGVMYWQFAEAILGGSSPRPCAACGKYMVLSGVREHGSKRADTRTCSDRCRKKFNRDQRAAAKRLRREGLTPKTIATQLGVDVDAVKGWLKGN